MAPTFSPLTSRLKMQLKLAISRLRLLQQKEAAISKLKRRELAELLENGKILSAKIRVENLIRDDITSELEEILELYCELLLARIGLLDAKICNPSLEEAVKSIIYCAPHLEIKELMQVKDMLTVKFGKEFVLQTLENTDNKVPLRVTKKLSAEAPEPKLINLYLKEIANAYDVDWSDDENQDTNDDSDDSDGSDGGILLKNDMILQKQEAPLEKEPILEEAIKEQDNENSSLSKKQYKPDDNQSSIQTPEFNRRTSIVSVKEIPDTPSFENNSPVTISPPSSTTDNPTRSIYVPPGISLENKKKNKSKSKSKKNINQKESKTANSKAAEKSQNQSQEEEFASLLERFNALKRS